MEVHVFFFQAEDGIRDLTVTGVQTCALPISPGSKTEPLQTPLTRNDPMRAWASGHSTTAVARPPTRLRCSPSKFHRSKAGPAATRASRPAPKRATPSETRSEERRVGKEGRSR